MLREKGDAVNRGEMLCAQAVAFNAISSELARRAALSMGEYVNATDTYMRLH